MFVLCFIFVGNWQKMTEQELYDVLDSWENIELVSKELMADPREFEILLGLALKHPKQRSWRAAYLVDKIHDEKPEIVRPYLPLIIDKLKTENNASKRRHWLRMVSANEINEEHFGFLFDYCIGVFTSGKEAVAVRVHAMQILYNISEKEPDLKPEVLQLIEHELEQNSSAGIRSRGKKLVIKLRKQCFN